jgi:glycine oxidase
VSAQRVAIIGGGVVGLGVGWRLAAAGCTVELFDRGAAGHGASWAAAGMLAAGVETEPSEEPLLALNRQAQRRWPEFAAELERVTGIDVGLRREGTLVVGLTRDDARQLRFTFDFQRRLGIDLAWLSGREAREREPHLHPGAVAAIYSPDDHQVDNRRVVQALKQAFVRAGGRLHEHTAVREIDSVGGSVCGVRIGDDLHPADAVLLAAGAWSRTIEGVPPESCPPVRPIKGQMLALRMDPARPILRHVLWAPKIYLVPRHDGRLLIGATVEERGFDPDLTAGGVLSLLEAAWRALPTIEELPIDEMWVGFRPGSRDDAPILGPTAIEGLTVATGHHRNGILLAPLTIDMISRHMLTGEIDPAIRAFGIDRFFTPATERTGSRPPAAGRQRADHQQTELA